MAKEVWKRDAEVDELYNKVFNEFLEFMNKDPQTITRSVYLINIAKDLERIADYATNFCEQVLYMVNGDRIQKKLKKLNS
ncbi:MAG: phosphate transport system protein [Thermosediminibacterales bacterium]|nr:phosphate transport system protein [Thermosediminibacterales bacterium]MDK2835477.1 phosphate transport system protein [Thermosediminibacterales bacterium]